MIVKYSLHQTDIQLYPVGTEISLFIVTSVNAA